MFPHILPIQINHYIVLIHQAYPLDRAHLKFLQPLLTQLLSQLSNTKKIYPIIIEYIHILKLYPLIFQDQNHQYQTNFLYVLLRL